MFCLAWGCRFFAKGAVDAYNSPTVLVAASNFSHNTATGIIKMEAYRGHSAGLSISELAKMYTSLCVILVFINVITAHKVFTGDAECGFVVRLCVK